MSVTRINKENTFPSDKADFVEGYFPSVAEVTAGQEFGPEDLLGDGKIQIDAPLLRQIISEALMNRPFNERAYRIANPDVDQACRSGTIKSAHEHFAFNGFFEGRSAGDAVVDEKWYVAAYPDLAVAARDGALSDLTRHFNETGRSEGRVCSALQLKERRRWERVLGPIAP